MISNVLIRCCLIFFFMSSVSATEPPLAAQAGTVDRNGSAQVLPSGSHPDMSGLNIFLDAPADTLDVAVLPNGEWWLWQGTEDRTLLIESRRLPALEYDPEAVRRLIWVEWPFARDIAVAPFPELSEKTGYPSFKAEFVEGGNEDTRRFVAALVLADEWSFWFVLQASVDAGSAAGESAMESLLLGMKPVDSADGDFLPGPGVPVYLAGAESPLQIQVMDAVVRLKKIVGPETAPGSERGGAAYRYDGPGEVAGAPALLFSFGENGPKEFAAARRFAVDETGAVYEMDVSSGGGYWKWEDGGVLWWGEYRQGATVLHIQNYRQGPSGMYFVFAFDVDGQVTLEGTAPARGRVATYGPLVFSLAEDDDSVAVVVDPHGQADSEGEDPSRLEGLYTRQ